MQNKVIKILPLALAGIIVALLLLLLLPVSRDTTTPTVVEDSLRQTFPITIKAGEATYTADVVAGTNMYDAMLAIREKTSFDFTSKEYTGLGYLVESINGVMNAGGTYWTIYINGEYSEVGASQYILQSEDVIEFRYEKF